MNLPTLWEPAPIDPLSVSDPGRCLGGADSFETVPVKAASWKEARAGRPGYRPGNPRDTGVSPVSEVALAGLSRAGTQVFSQGASSYEELSCELSSCEDLLPFQAGRTARPSQKPATPHEVCHLGAIPAPTPAAPKI